MGGDDPDADGDTDGDEPLPEDVVERAEQLTRRAREAVDDAEAAAYRSDRDAVLDEHGYRARVRDEDDVLVLHPAEWIEDGTIQVDRVEDVSRGVEVPLSGPGGGDDWDAIEAHNRELAAAVAGEYGEPHGRTAHALADFAGNHYAKSITELTAAELAEFREEYLPRNAWPTDAQLRTLDESIRLVFDAADARVPGSEANG